MCLKIVPYIGGFLKRLLLAACLRMVWKCQKCGMAATLRQFRATAGKTGRAFWCGQFIAARRPPSCMVSIHRLHASKGIP